MYTYFTYSRGVFLSSKRWYWSHIFLSWQMHNYFSSKYICIVLHFSCMMNNICKRVCHSPVIIFIFYLYQYQTWKLLFCSQKRWSHCRNRDWCFGWHWMLLCACLLFCCRSLTNGVVIAPKQFINSIFYQFVYIMIIIHSTWFLKFLFLKSQRTKKLRL